MGRPRKFDTDRAIEVASDLFWRKGYDQTSLQDLTAAMGISAPSFYFAFGSKEALFMRVVEAYRRERVIAVRQALARPTLGQALARMFEVVIEFLTDPAHPPGCMIINNSLPLDESHSFRVVLAEQREEWRLRLRDRLERAKAEGEVPPDGLESDALSRLIVSVMWGFAVEAQSGTSREALIKARDALLALLGGDHAGHNHAAPRTPEESPWRGGDSLVSTRSENT